MPEGMPYGKKQAPASGGVGPAKSAQTETALMSDPKPKGSIVSGLGASRAPRVQEGEPEVRSGKSGPASGNGG